MFLITIHNLDRNRVLGSGLGVVRPIRARALLSSDLLDIPESLVGEGGLQRLLELFEGVDLLQVAEVVVP